MFLKHKITQKEGIRSSEFYWRDPLNLGNVSVFSVFCVIECVVCLCCSMFPYLAVWYAFSRLLLSIVMCFP